VNTQRLAEELLLDEGLVLHAYADSLGYLTIGVGRLIDERKGGGITEPEALLLLDNDIRRHWGELAAALPWVAQAPEAVQEVLANMCFNLGLAGLLGFRQTLAHLEAGRFAEAAAEMLRSKWAGQVGARAERLAARLREL
jgi:lysozyme